MLRRRGGVLGGHVCGAGRMGCAGTKEVKELVWAGVEGGAGPMRPCGRAEGGRAAWEGERSRRGWRGG